MVTPTLVGPDLAGGERLLAELDRDKLPIVAAFWCYPTPQTDWRLIIATPLVDREGTLPVYRRLQAALDRVPDTRLSLSEVFAVGEADPVVRALRQMRLPDVGRDHPSVTINFATATPYAPYLAEDATGVSLYPYRVVSSADAGAFAAQASIKAETSVRDAAKLSEQVAVQRSDEP